MRKGSTPRRASRHEEASGDQHDEVPATEITGVVVQGFQEGRELGFPTANLAITEGTPVRDGVWAGEVFIFDRPDARSWVAAVSVGTRPTYQNHDGARVLEAHLLGFDGDLYHRSIRVVLHQFIRDQYRFSSPRELSLQIEDDVRGVKEWDLSRKRSAATNVGVIR